MLGVALAAPTPCLKQACCLSSPSAAPSLQAKRQAGAAGNSAIVRFDSPVEAQRAARSKQGGYCGSATVRLKVLV